MKISDLKIKAMNEILPGKALMLSGNEAVIVDVDKGKVGEPVTVIQDIQFTGVSIVADPIEGYMLRTECLVKQEVKVKKTVSADCRSKEKSK